MKKIRQVFHAVAGIVWLCAGAACDWAGAPPVAFPETEDELRKAIFRMRPPPLTALDVRVRLHVKDFGALPNDGKDDRAAVESAIHKAKGLEGPVQIDFAPGVYNFYPPSADFSQGNAALILEGCRNLVIDGHGAEILIHRGDMSFAKVVASSNVIVRNFVIDYDPLPFSQGTVQEVSPGNGSFVFELHPGFPPPNDPFLQTCWGLGNSWGMLKDTKTPGRLKADTPCHFRYGDIAALENNRFQITLKRKEQIAHFERGDVFVIVGRFSSIGRTHQSENVTFDHLTIHASSSALFIGWQTSLLNVLNCKALLKGNRLITGGADGVHVQSARVGPWIENCEFQGLSDDCLNIYGPPVYVLEQVSPVEMRVVKNVPIQPGDTLVFFNPHTGAMQETAAVSLVEDMLTVQHPVGELNLPPKGTPHDPRGWQIYDHAYNISCIGNGFVFRNNHLRDGRRFGAYIKASFGLIENNRFEGLSDSAMQVKNSPGWPEGFFARNLIIRGNTISECGYGLRRLPIWIAGRTLNEGRLFEERLIEAPFHRNIFFMDNVIESLSGPAAEFSSIDTLHIEGNRFSSRDHSGPMFLINRSKNVTERGNHTGD